MKRPSRYPLLFGLTLGELALTAGKNPQYFYQNTKGAVALLEFVRKLEAGLPQPQYLGKSIHHKIDFLELAQNLIQEKPGCSLFQTEDVISFQIILEKNEWIVEFIDESVVVFLNAHTLYTVPANQACEVLQNVWNAVFDTNNIRI